MTIIIRALEPPDWKIFRSLRLKALQNHPGNFLDEYTKSEGQPESYWQEMLDGNGKKIFGLFDGKTLIGIGGVWIEEAPEVGQFAAFHMMFIEDEYRGKKLSRLLYEERIKFARDSGVNAAYVSHRKSNDASKFANQKFGFKLHREDKIVWPDGQEEIDCIYKLDL